MKRTNKYIFLLKRLVACLLLMFFFGTITAQEKKENKKELKEVQGFLSDGNDEIAEDNFVGAEVNYRKAIAISPAEEIGKYNLGNAYYNEAKNEEAMRRFAQSGGGLLYRAPGPGPTPGRERQDHRYRCVL